MCRVNFGQENPPYDALGGETQVLELATAFYDIMDANPAYAGIRALHPDDLTESREKFFAFLSGWLGGPDLYVKQHGHPRLRMRHAPFPIGTLQRDQWLGCMAQAQGCGGISGDVRAFLDARFAHVADFMRNTEG